jgi:putative nucleotidyltransferase with HDIG domain
MGLDTAINTAVETFLDDHQCLNAMSENSARILKLLGDPNFRTRQLVKLIEQDAAIAAKVIRTVNSAAYARANRITQLDRATVYLGFMTVKEIVVATTVQAICKPVVFGKYATRDLWDHSVGVAVLCREFANRSGLVDPELAFLAGILHDVGLLLAAQSEVETTTEICRDAEDLATPFRQVEQSYFGFDHCELGERLAGSWNFPEEVAAAINWHHSPSDAPGPFRCLCQHVFAADTLCGHSGVGFPLTTAFQTVSDSDLHEINLTRSDTDEVLDRFKVLLRLHLS